MCSVRIADSDYHANHGIYEDYKCYIETQHEKNSWKISQSFSSFISQQYCLELPQEKCKCVLRSILVRIGYTLPMGSRASLGRKNWFLERWCGAKISYLLYLKTTDIHKVPKQEKYYARVIKIS